MRHSLSENFAADCCQLARRWSDAARNSGRIPYGAGRRFIVRWFSNSMHPYAANNERRGDSDLPFHFSNKTRIQYRFRSKRFLAKFDGVIVYNRKKVFFGNGNAFLQKPFDSTSQSAGQPQSSYQKSRDLFRMIVRYLKCCFSKRLEK